MKCNVYYYEDLKKVVVTDDVTKPVFDSLSQNIIIINLENKEIEKIYDFFKYITVKAILSDKEKIMFDYEELKGTGFYEEDSFTKLIELFDNLIESANSTLKEIKESTKEEKV